MTARTNFKIYIRGRHSKLLEEHVGHVGVVMLSGVDECLLHSWMFA
jgi:hypothetical protein